MCSKNKQFGIGERQHEDGPSNKQRLHDELNDLIATVEMLNEEEGFEFTPNRDKIEAKKAKVAHYRKYSRSLGTVE